MSFNLTDQTQNINILSHLTVQMPKTITLKTTTLDGHVRKGKLKREQVFDVKWLVGRYLLLCLAVMQNSCSL